MDVWDGGLDGLCWGSPHGCNVRMGVQLGHEGLGDILWQSSIVFPHLIPHPLEVQRSPSCQVGAEGEVHVLHDSVGGPTTRIVDGLRVTRGR